MLFKSSNHPAEPLFHELNILKFDKLEKLKMRIFMWNVLHDEVPETSKSYISIRERSYGNQNLKFYLPIANTNLLKRDIVYQGPKLWTIYLLIKEAKKLFSHLNLLITIICCTINEKISFSLHSCTFIYLAPIVAYADFHMLGSHTSSFILSQFPKLFRKWRLDEWIVPKSY